MAELNRVRGVIEQNVDLAASGLGIISHGIEAGDTLAVEDWLLAGQNIRQENGTYALSTGGVWSRRDATATLLAGDTVTVMEGSQVSGMKGSLWKYVGSDAPVDGAGPISFVLHAYGEILRPKAPLELNFPFIQLANRSLPESEVPFPALSVDVHGLVKGIDIVEGTEGYISGGEFDIGATSEVNITPLAAYIPSVADVVAYEGGQLQPEPRTANRMYYLYLTEDETINDTLIKPAPLEDLGIVSHAPSAMVEGPGQASEYEEGSRFFGAYRADASGNRMPQMYDSQIGLVFYLVDTSVAPNKVESVTATTARQIGLGEQAGASGVAHRLVPPGARYAYMRIDTNATAAAFVGNPIAPGDPIRVPANDNVVCSVPLDSSQRITVYNNASGGSTNVIVLGYFLRR